VFVPLLFVLTWAVRALDRADRLDAAAGIGASR
jgi:hypothetical protein